jgi:hypothetical protein
MELWWLSGAEDVLWIYHIQLVRVDVRIVLADSLHKLVEDQLVDKVSMIISPVCLDSSIPCKPSDSNEAHH